MRARPALLTVLALAACGGSPTGEPGDAAPADARADAAPDAATCGRRGGPRGKTAHTIDAGGLTRTYHVYLPPALDPTTPLPVVFVFHGFTMSGQAMYDVTEFAELADAEGIALVFPDGQGGPNSASAPWNVGEGVCNATTGAPPVAEGDDFAMIDAILADLAEDQCLDREHVFASGFSMGGYFTNHLGCERDDFAGLAPHSGGSHALTACPVARKPIILFHGTADALIPPSCGRTAADRWAAHNGCATTTTSRSVSGGTCERYDGCPAGGQVELCTFTLMGHCWAGGPLGSGFYACPPYASATSLAWQFWKAFAW